MTSGGTRAQRYLAHLDVLAGGVEPVFFPAQSTTPGVADVAAITFLDLPEPGLLTAFTYGLSLVDHEDWVYGRPELCLTVRSEDVGWARALALVAEQQRGQCPFSFGNMIDFGGPIVEGTRMDSFVVFGAAVVEADDAAVDVGDNVPVQIVGLYPIHRREREFITQHGLEAFWDREWDPYDVTRAVAV